MWRTDNAAGQWATSRICASIPVTTFPNLVSASRCTLQVLPFRATEHEFVLGVVYAQSSHRSKLPILTF